MITPARTHAHTHDARTRVPARDSKNRAKSQAAIRGWHKKIRLGESDQRGKAPFWGWLYACMS